MQASVPFASDATYVPTDRYVSTEREIPSEASLRNMDVLALFLATLMTLGPLAATGQLTP